MGIFPTSWLPSRMQPPTRIPNLDALNHPPQTGKGTSLMLVTKDGRIVYRVSYKRGRLRRLLGLAARTSHYRFDPKKQKNVRTVIWGRDLLDDRQTRDILGGALHQRVFDKIQQARSIVAFARQARPSARRSSSMLDDIDFEHNVHQGLNHAGSNMRHQIDAQIRKIPIDSAVYRSLVANVDSRLNDIENHVTDYARNRDIRQFYGSLFAEWQADGTVRPNIPQARTPSSRPVDDHAATPPPRTRPTRNGESRAPEVRNRGHNGEEGRPQSRLRLLHAARRVVEGVFHQPSQHLSIIRLFRAGGPTSSTPPQDASAADRDQRVLTRGATSLSPTNLLRGARAWISPNTSTRASTRASTGASAGATIKPTELELDHTGQGAASSLSRAPFSSAESAAKSDAINRPSAKAAPLNGKTDAKKKHLRPVKHLRRFVRGVGKGSAKAKAPAPEKRPSPPSPQPIRYESNV